VTCLGGRGMVTRRPGRCGSSRRRDPDDRGCVRRRGGSERRPRATPDQVSGALVAAFGGPAEEAVPVIVLNGDGVPGIGEAVAERILPGGFRVAVSQNASEFDHPKTLIVIGSPDDVGLAERVRDLLRVGSVSVSVGSGVAPVDGRDREGLHRVSVSEGRRAG